MKKLELMQMEKIAAGNGCSDSGKVAVNVIKDVACVATGFWPIGTLIAGPTCAGMIIASALC
jgi:hypothetical protein